MSVRKGRITESLVRDWLAMEGWLVHQAATAGLHKHGSFFASKGHDIYGCFDLLAVRGDATWAIQSTTGANRAARRKKIAAVSKDWPATWRVSVVVHEWERISGNKGGVANGTRHVLLAEDMLRGGSGVWREQEEIEIDVKAIEVWRKKTRGVVALRDLK